MCMNVLLCYTIRCPYNTICLTNVGTLLPCEIEIVSSCLGDDTVMSYALG